MSEKETPCVVKTAELRVFTPRPPETKVNEHWVELLEEALARAKAGETWGGAVIESSAENAQHALAGIKNRWEFVGHLHKIIEMTLEK
jgi:hypothetical protein